MMQLYISVSGNFNNSFCNQCGEIYIFKIYTAKRICHTIKLFISKYIHLEDIVFCNNQIRDANILYR